MYKRQCSLSGIVYILDEPCKGLHYRDINSIIKVTKSLSEKGNTVIAIEHNKQYITAVSYTHLDVYKRQPLEWVLSV